MAGGDTPLDLNHFIEQLNANKGFEESRARCASGATFKNGKRVGRMSTGYFYGMMLTFAKAVCKVKEAPNGDLYSGILTSPAGSARKDTFAHKGYVASLQGDPLVQNYSLLLSLGMLESSGMYNEGIDRSASNTNGITTEAGLFQVSYNSVNPSQVPNRIYDELMTRYNRGQDATACMTGLFQLDQRLSKNTKSFGSGAALEFQNAMKSCPAMAAEYMSILLRRDVNHNGPLKREEAQPSKECSEALTVVKRVAESNCGGLDAIAKNLPTAKADKEAARFKVAPDRKVVRVDSDGKEVEVELARLRGGSTLSQREDEIAQLEDELKYATTDEEKAAIGKQLELAKADYEKAQKDPELLKEREGVDQRNEEALKAEQVQSQESFDALAKAEGYADKNSEEVEKLNQEAKEKDEQAKIQEALAQEEKKKPRSEWNKEIINSAIEAREIASAKQKTYIEAKQAQELKQKINENEQQLNGQAVESMKAAEKAVADASTAVEAKKVEIFTGKKTKGDDPTKDSEKSAVESGSPEQLAAELKKLEAKREASLVALTNEKELRASLENLKAEFKVVDRNDAQKAKMIIDIGVQLEAIEKRIDDLKKLDPTLKGMGAQDRLIVLMELRRRLRAELNYYKIELKAEEKKLK